MGVDSFHSASIFRNKISGARRKIEREYDLHFVDGPILLPQENDVSCDDSPRAWWLRSDDGTHTLVHEAFEYILEQTDVETYDAIIGFSQGGTLATALALTGSFPNVRKILTVGAPYISDAFEVASELASSKRDFEKGLEIPKLHFAGEKDTMVSVDWTMSLCEKAGNGVVLVHDQGHIFPTRAARVKEMLDFLRDEDEE